MRSRPRGFARRAGRTVVLLADAVTPTAPPWMVYTRQELPQGWAMTQNNLGIALRAQAARTSGLRTGPLLADAVRPTAPRWRSRPARNLPQDWAVSQNNLGNALQRPWRSRTRGPEAVALLADAVGLPRRLRGPNPRRKCRRTGPRPRATWESPFAPRRRARSGPEAVRLLADAVMPTGRAGGRTREDCRRTGPCPRIILGVPSAHGGAHVGPEAVALLAHAVGLPRAQEVYTRRIAAGLGHDPEQPGNRPPAQGSARAGLRP